MSSAQRTDLIMADTNPVTLTDHNCMARNYLCQV
jgi:hypothetical protein